RCRRTLEGPQRICAAPLPGKRLREPEGTAEEHPLTTLQTILALVPQEQPVAHQLLTDGLGGPLHPLVVEPDEVDPGQQQERRINLVAAVTLDKDVAIVVYAVRLYVDAEPVTLLAPAFQRR